MIINNEFASNQIKYLLFRNDQVNRKIGTEITERRTRSNSHK
jgi:hypothetical protein